MIKDIVLGNRRNNILSYIQKSRLAKATVIGNCVCIYYLYFSQSRLVIRDMITIGIIGLLLFNLDSRKRDEDTTSLIAAIP